MIKCRAIKNYTAPVNVGRDENGNSIEPYKTIPAWVCKNLILYGSCFINDTLYKKIGRATLKEFDPKITITPYENGMVLKHGN